MTSSFEKQLGAQLRAAATGQKPHRRTRWLSVGVAAAALAVVGAVMLRSPEPALADVEVTHQNGRIEILLTDLESDPPEVEAALRSEGLDVDVTGVPTGPSNRGRFTGIVSSDPDVIDIHDNGPGQSFLGFSIPENWTGSLDIVLGRLAAGGESYEAFTDAFAASEPLACSGIQGLPLSQAAESLKGLDVSVQPVNSDGVLLNLEPLEVALSGDQQDWIVTAGTAMSATTLILDTAPEATRLPPLDSSC